MNTIYANLAPQITLNNLVDQLINLQSQNLEESKNKIKEIFNFAKSNNLQVDFTNVNMGSFGKIFKKFHKLFQIKKNNIEENVEVLRSYIGDDRLKLTTEQEEEYLSEVIRNYCRNRGRLFFAAYNDDVDEINELLDGGVDINSTNTIGRTPLMAAATSNKIEATILLLKRGANVDFITSEGYTILNGMALKYYGLNKKSYEAENTVKMLKMLWKRSKSKSIHALIAMQSESESVTNNRLNEIPRNKIATQINEKLDGKAPIHLAVIEERLNIVQWLIKQGVSINDHSENDHSENDHSENDHSENDHSENDHSKKKTALDYAIYNGNEQIKEYLINNGARSYQNLTQANRQNPATKIISERTKQGTGNIVTSIISERAVLEDYYEKLISTYNKSNIRGDKIKAFNDHLSNKLVRFLNRDDIISSNEVARPRDWKDMGISATTELASFGVPIAMAIGAARDASFSWNSGKTEQYRRNIVPLINKVAEQLTSKFEWQICQLSLPEGIESFANFFCEKLENELHRSSMKAGLTQIGQWAYTLFYTQLSLAPELVMMSILTDPSNGNNSYLRLDEDINDKYTTINDSRTNPWNSKELLQNVGIIYKDTIYYNESGTKINKDTKTIEFKYGLRKGDEEDIKNKNLKSINKESLNTLFNLENKQSKSGCIII